MWSAFHSYGFNLVLINVAFLENENNGFLEEYVLIQSVSSKCMVNFIRHLILEKSRLKGYC